MIKTFFLCLTSFALTVVAGFIYIPICKRKKIGQPIYEYVEKHKGKSGTPTAGGLFFLIPAVIAFAAFYGIKAREIAVTVAIGLAFLLVGFLDDFLKVKGKHNEGLKPYQKIVFQTGIATIFGVFAFVNGLTDFYIPFFDITLNFGVFTVFFDAFIFIATTNCVNLTDGIDGLASSVSLWFLVVISLIIYFGQGENDFIYLSVALIGAILGFLVFNKSKASVFMGDTGSLSLGGFLAAISVLSGNAFYILIVGSVFVWTGISVIIQVLYFKATKRRVFLMAPFHHHLQMKGLSEEKICYYYSLVTVLMGTVSLIF